MNETTILLNKESTSQLFCKNDCFGKKFCLVMFAVVCGLAIVFAVLMTKWHLISQSVITPTVSLEQIDENGVLSLQQGETPRDKEIDEFEHGLAGPPGSQEADKPDYRGGRPGATAPQLGKAFPLTILAQIAWKDLSNMFTFGSSGGSGTGHDLAQSVSLMPVYVNEQDCIYSVNYFENEVIGGDTKDCQYIDLNHLVFGKNKCEQDDNNDKLTSQSEMSRITNKIIDYFNKNYANYLIDCEIVDVRMIKYLSNGTRYSGLHSETHYIDGERIIDAEVDYVGIVFLNDNFNGGNLQFLSPKSIDIIEPQVGNGVLFGGGLDYSHRVTPVTNGDRYVLKIIFNKN